MPERSEGEGRPARPPRARGGVAITVAAAPGGGTRLLRLRQEGSGKCLIPARAAGPGLEAVLLNTAGGLTGGDRLVWEAEAGPGAALTVTTQAAERLYRALPGETARVGARLRAGPGAMLDWLPQETIVFDGAAAERRIEAELAADARLTILEAVVLGRQAMGETVAEIRFAEQWRVTRAGRLLHAEALRLPREAAALARPALLGPNRAFATLLHAAPDAEARLAEARACLAGEAAASAWDGRLVVRWVAPDGFALRQALARFLAGFRGAGLPRVWSL